MKNKAENVFFIFFLLIAIFSRFLPLKLPNVEFFSSLIAFTILLHDKNKFLYAIPFVVIFSDGLLSFKVPFMLKWEIIVFISWFVVILVQYVVSGKKILNVISMELLGTLAFFLVSNSLVFFMFDFYPKSFSGYLTCLLAGLPFLRNQLIYNFFFSFLVYGTIRLLEHGKVQAENELKNENP